MKTSTCLGLMALILALAVGVTACGPKPHHGPNANIQRGAAMGAAVGATAGALIDSDNPWRGGFIGGALGAAVGGTLADISNRAAQEAGTYQKPVYYQNNDGHRVEAYPMGPRGNCQLVREKYYNNGQLVKVVERTVCD